MAPMPSSVQATGIWVFSANATQVVPGLGVEDAVAGQDDRPLGRGDLGGGELELAAVAVHVGPEAGQAGDDLVLGRVARRASPAGGRPW